MKRVALFSLFKWQFTNFVQVFFFLFYFSRYLFFPFTLSPPAYCFVAFLFPLFLLILLYLQRPQFYCWCYCWCDCHCCCWYYYYYYCCWCYCRCHHYHRSVMLSLTSFFLLFCTPHFVPAPGFLFIHGCVFSSSQQSGNQAIANGNPNATLTHFLFDDKKTLASVFFRVFLSIWLGTSTHSCCACAQTHVKKKFNGWM